jgi:ubiquinol oxidase
MLGVDNLYDVFVNVRDDEAEHVKTMVACQQPEARLTFKSPHEIPLLVTANPESIAVDS